MTEAIATAAPPPPDPADVERELRARIEGRTMLFELGLDEAEYRRLRSVLFKLTRTTTVAEMSRRYPALLATYMAYAGTFIYEGHEYWPLLHPVFRDPDLEPGRHFLGAVKRLGLEPFDRIVIEDGGLRWVSRILAQGGIPRAYLGPFVEAITRELSDGAADGEAILAAWRARNASLTTLHAPTRRFLLYAGDPAVDLVDRCLDVLRERQRGNTTAAELAGLPQYVLESLAGAPALPRTSSGAARERIARPQLRIDPWDTLGPVVVLPPVESDQLGGRWRVEAGELAHRQEPSSYAAETIRLPAATVADVEFLSAQGVRRRWSFELLGESSVLLFDPESQRVLHDAGALAADEVWLLLPAASSVCVQSSDGTAAPREIEALPAPVGAWSGFVIRHLDLRGMRRLSVDHGQGRSWAIAVGPRKAKPALEGRRVDGVSIGAAPVYADVPSVTVPHVADGFSWQVRVTGPEGTQHEYLTAEGGVLDVRSLFGQTPFGRYEVRVRGPIGLDLTTRVAVVADLVVRRPAEIVFPGSQPDDVVVQAPGVRCGDKAEGEAIRLPIPDEASTRVLVTLAHRDGRSVDLAVGVPRLMWSIVHDTKPALAVAPVRVRVDAEEFDDHLADTLMVSTGRAGVDMRLELHDRHGTVASVLPAVTTVGDAGRWAFDLGPFADTIRAAQGARMSLHLSIGIRGVHVADIASGVRVRRLVARQEDRRVVVSFEQDRPATERLLRLWPDCQPWLGARTFAIADGEQSITIDSDQLEPTTYRVDVGIDDGWTTPVRPVATTPGIGSLRIGDRGDELAWLDGLDATTPQTLVTCVLARHRRDLDISAEALYDGDVEIASGLEMLVRDTAEGQPPNPQFGRLVNVANATSRLLAEVIARAGESDPDGLWTDRLDLRLVGQINVPKGALDERLMSVVWQACPGTAAQLDLPFFGEEQVADRCRRLLAWMPGSASPDASGAQVNQLALNLPAAQLRDMRFELGLVPTGLLDPAVRQLGTFDWLLAAQEDRDSDNGPRRWFANYQRLTEETPKDLPSNVMGEYQRHLEARLAPRGTEAWAGVAAVLLAAAAHHRWGSRAAGLTALETALSWGRRIIRSDQALLTVLKVTPA